MLFDMFKLFASIVADQWLVLVAIRLHVPVRDAVCEVVRWCKELFVGWQPTFRG
jgi:hypothetical protein